MSGSREQHSRCRENRLVSLASGSATDLAAHVLCSHVMKKEEVYRAAARPGDNDACDGSRPGRLQPRVPEAGQSPR